MTGPARPGFGERLAAISTAEWTAWLHRQRWFGAKAADPSQVHVGLLLPFEHEGHCWAVVRLDVEVAGATRWYQVLLVDDNQAGIRTALDDPAFRRFLADAFARGWSVERDGARWAAVAAGATPLVIPPDARIDIGRAEQSNTSLRVGELAILKLFRRIEPGAHPDVEMTDFLTRHGFPYTPTLLGTLVLEQRGERTIAGMLQELVPGARDAWEYALAASRAWFTGGGAGKGALPFVEDAAKIGRITRELHEVLASDDDAPDFAPEAATSEDVEAWGAATRAQVEDALDLLARATGAPASPASPSAGSGFPAERRAEAEAVLRRREHYLARVDELVDEVGDDAGFMIRHHGDYHLGQLLHSAGGQFMIIDFEGEPSRPLAQRRRKASPLRDVSGMLRSFAYAAATLAGEQARADLATREIASGRWERAVRSAFLDAYLGERDEEASDFLPEDPANVRALVALFEMEKVFYELSYELNNRPSWVGIPLRGIARATGG